MNLLRRMEGSEVSVRVGAEPFRWTLDMACDDGLVLEEPGGGATRLAPWTAVSWVELRGEES